MYYEDKSKDEIIFELEQLKKEIIICRQTQDDLINFIKLSSDVFVLVGIDGKIEHIDQTFCKIIFGCNPEEMIGRSCVDFIKNFVHPDDLEITLEVARNGIKHKEINGVINRFFCQDGSIRWYKWTNTLLVNEGLFYVVGHEITEQKNTEENLKKSNDQLNNILESIHDAFIAIDDQWRISYFNREAERIYNRNRQEVIGKVFWNVFSRYIGTNFYKILYRSMNDKVSVHSEGKGIYSKGWVEVHVYPSNNGISVFYRDISERKRMEIALNQSEERYQQLVELSPDIISVHHEASILYINQSGANLLGLKKKEELYGRSTLEFIYPDYWESCKAMYWSVIQGNTVPFTEIKLIRIDGIIIDVEISLALLSYQGKKCVRCVIRDITNRKLMLEKLSLSEERFYKAFYYSPVAMTINSFDSGKFINTNDINLKMHGYTEDEFLGRTALDLNLWVNIDERDKWQKEIRKKGFVYNHEIISCKKSGEIFIALMSAVVINLNGEQCILTIKSDITELRQYQKEILRLDKLNLIGEMAAGIAHEIRNPLTTVRGFLQILGEKDMYYQDKEKFDLLIEEIDRANSIITNFLSLAKNRVVDYKMHNLNNILNYLFPLIQADALVSDKYVILELNEIPNLFLDEREFRQLVLNLSRNGLEAMPSGKFMTMSTYVESDEVVLSVRDCGKGIPDDILDKIGTPFFTTKDNGTGLGLATCYSIAARHNASINFVTGPEGTIFYVRFKISPLNMV